MMFQDITIANGYVRQRTLDNLNWRLPRMGSAWNCRPRPRRIQLCCPLNPHVRDRQFGNVLDFHLLASCADWDFFQGCISKTAPISTGILTKPRARYG
jgi:hypothetical protein